MRLPNQVAIITGAGAGIGKATALLFAQEGAHIVVADRAPERAQETVAQIQAAGGQALLAIMDVTDGAAVAQLSASTLLLF